jgi:hypothetical protein
MTISQTRATTLLAGLKEFKGFWSIGEHFKITNEGQICDGEKLKAFVIRLFCYNHNCYIEKYSHHENIGKRIKTIKVKVKNPYTELISLADRDSACQCLKTLKCLDYNIEAEYFDEKERKEAEKDLIILRCLVAELKDLIIEDLQEYKGADWGG